MSLEETVCALRDSKDDTFMLAPLARRLAAMVDADGSIKNGWHFVCFTACMNV